MNCWGLITREATFCWASFEEFGFILPLKGVPVFFMIVNNVVKEKKAEKWSWKTAWAQKRKSLNNQGSTLLKIIHK